MTDFTQAGSDFEASLTWEQRKQYGAHYTSRENMARLLNPLIIEELWREEYLGNIAEVRARVRQLQFLDPAAGCANFLLAMHRWLAAFDERTRGDDEPIDFTGMFVGIEINEDAVAVAKLQDPVLEMHVANATRVDWRQYLDEARELVIVGNPPFVGSNRRTAEQKEDMELVWGGQGYKGYKSLDYVSCWFKKAAELMAGWERPSRAAFVTTNSLNQGRSVAVMEQLREKLGVGIIDVYERNLEWA